jgi:hypothetical protein
MIYRTLLVVLLLAFAGTAFAEPTIVPETVNTAGGFGAARTPPWCQPKEEVPGNIAIECDLPIPDGATHITGTGGWWFFLSNKVAYITVKFWHDAGTPHKLRDFVISHPDSQSMQQQRLGEILPLPVPGGGHRVPGTRVPRVWFDAYCVPAAGVNPLEAVCGVEGTVHFLVP